MTTEERLAVVETRVEWLYHELPARLDKIDAQLDCIAVERARWEWAGKVVWIALGAIVPIAIAAAASGVAAVLRVVPASP